MSKSLLFGVAALLLACEHEDPLSGNPIDSNISIETREVLETNSRRLTFYCKTEKIYPCMNFPLLTETKIDGNSMKITFTSVGESMLCATALGPATTSIDLDALPTGVYGIEFNNANLKNKGTLKVTDTEIELVFGNENGIEILRPVTKRVPDRTYWGTIGYHVASSSALVEEFLQKFEDIGATFHSQAPGHYFYYEIDSQGKIITDTENSGYYFVEGLIFQYDGDESVLKDLIQIEGQNYKEDLSIYVQTYKGEQINNWSN